MSNELLKAIAVTAELTGAELSKSATLVMERDLSEYPEQAVLNALVRCRRELKGKLCLAAIIERISDGRIGAEEAWAMIPKREEDSAVWTEEMAQAWGIARGVYESGDEIGARMAFKEAYKRACDGAREQRRPVRWIPTLGWDPSARESVIVEAVRLGRLTQEHATRLLPYHQVEPGVVALLCEAEARVALGVCEP